MNSHQRAGLIYRLIRDDIDCIDDEGLAELLEKGCSGYVNMSDEDLLDQAEYRGWNEIADFDQPTWYLQ